MKKKLGELEATAVGSLSFDAISQAKDYVLVEASKPLIGQIGFTVMTIAAMISTFSAINGSIYGGSRVSYELSEDDEVPHEFTYQLWNKPIGLFITALLTLGVANFVNLENISISGSAGFLFIFAVVNVVAFRNAEEIKSKRAIPSIGALLCFSAFVVLLVQQFGSNRTGVLIAGGIMAICFLFEFVFKRFHG